MDSDPETPPPPLAVVASAVPGRRVPLRAVCLVAVAAEAVAAEAVVVMVAVVPKSARLLSAYSAYSLSAAAAKSSAHSFDKPIAEAASASKLLSSKLACRPLCSHVCSQPAACRLLPLTLPQLGGRKTGALSAMCAVRALLGRLFDTLLLLRDTLVPRVTLTSGTLLAGRLADRLGGGGIGESYGDVKGAKGEEA